MDITKIFTVESSHVVRNCTSRRCSMNVHGHSYKIEITLSASHLDNAHMIMDFGLMKGPIKELVDSMDHCHIICDSDSEEYIRFFREHNERWIILPFNPTAEMLSMFIFRFVDRIIKKTTFGNGESVDLKVGSVTVHETATGRATCYATDLLQLWNTCWDSRIQFSNGVMENWSDDLRDIILAGKNVVNPIINQQITIDKI